ncbi:MAG: biotin/lipoyl-containing protein [Candidatus Cloacimonadota bacterium]|nr:biotin/lipoyl-containing protein [Candidatus Cloacimonadota bacterium]
MKTYKMEINGEKFEGKVVEYDGLNIKVDINGIKYQVKMEPEFGKTEIQFKRSKKIITDPPTIEKKPDKEPGPIIGKVQAPLPGAIIDIMVKVGDKIKTGDVVLILEAMKMESEIMSDYDGTVKTVPVQKGDNVSEEQVLVEIEVAK